jgi:hypothetical protein
MKRRALWIALLAAIALETIVDAQQSASSSKSAKGLKNPVQEITLPNYPVEMPPGPNLAGFQQHCLLCHSA